MKDLLLPYQKGSHPKLGIFLQQAIQTKPTLGNKFPITNSFEFLPHFNRWNRDFIDKGLLYSKITGISILACNDGDGIIIESNNLDIIGEVILIKDGEIKTPQINDLINIHR